MSDDLDKKLKQIADMFGVSDTGSLKNIVESIVPPSSTSSSSANTNTGGPSAEPSPSYNTDSRYTANPAAGNRSLDIGLMSKLGEMLSAFNNVNDSRITLLHSVQPFLGSQRQQRLGGAIQLLKIVAILNSIAPGLNRNTKG